jgi:ATP-binding cassette subfamily F protein uup
VAIASLENVRKVYGSHEVLTGASVTIEEGERVGLVGANGCGKSTLARILAGIEEIDSGRVVHRRDANVLYLDQDPRLPADRSARDVVLDGLAKWRALSDRYAAITSRIAASHGAETGDESGGESGGAEAGGVSAAAGWSAAGEPVAGAARLAAEQAEAVEALERAGGWARLHEADAMLGHLGIPDPTALCGTMSGGQRRRVAMARVLVARPALAVLDEPTNHLDIETIEWLEDFLARKFKGALLLVTHDRDVLDNVVTRTLEIERGVVESYAGGYGAYLAGKAEREAYDERVDSNRRNYLRAEMEWLRRSPKARTGKQKARIKRAEAAIAVPAPEYRRTAALDGSTVRSGKTVLSLEGLAIARGGRTLLSGLDLQLRAGDRIGVVGANGTGKTTLLRTILGDFEPAAGRVVAGAGTRIAYLDQERSNLDDGESIYENVAKGRGTVQVGDRSIEPAQYLERFLFDRASQRRPVAGLSGGERARVAFAKLLVDPANLLLLDEPTNDLDVDTLLALESMLLEYTGSIVIVTHDRRLLDRVATRTLVLEAGAEATASSGKAVVYAGGYEDARRQRAAAEQAANAADVAAALASTVAGAADDGSKWAGRKPRQRSTLSYNDRIELDGILEAIDAAEADVARLEAELADPSRYQQVSRIAELAADLETARVRAEMLVARWEELETKKAGG